MRIPLEELKKATALTREGRLTEATHVLQKALGGGDPPWAEAQDAAPAARSRRPRTVSDLEIADVVARSVPEAAAQTRPPERAARAEGGGPGPAPRPQQAPSRAAVFDAHRFSCGAGSCRYWLFVPPHTGETALPVVVMLHGCTQDAPDFAAGTAMNELAAQRGCIVVYPEQAAHANQMRCWNWFEPSHQRRGSGEPALIAALAAHVVQTFNGDPQRVYVAGLSAGGAMAAVVAQLYPEVFAAVGVHSGLPAGAAGDLQSAQAAMRRGARAQPRRGPVAAVPTIVFHGRSDRTVHPENGRQLSEAAAAQATASGAALRREEQQLAVAGRNVKRTVYRDANQLPQVEYWEIGAAKHAWSGGSASGSYTDTAGPNASAAMLDFFLLHRLPAARAS